MRDITLNELDGILARRLDRLTDAELVNEPDDDRALRAVDPRLDARVVADRDVGGLDRGQRARGELGDPHVAVIDVGPGHLARVADHPDRNEVTHGADYRLQRRAEPPVHDVD